MERGRDFGEPSYNTFRQLCGLVKAQTFEDFTDQISKKVKVKNIILMQHKFTIQNNINLIEIYQVFNLVIISQVKYI